MPLVIPPDCALRVGDETRIWEPGKLLMLDDTIRHEAWNHSDRLRVVLIFDVWHPMPTDHGRELVSPTVHGLLAYRGDDDDMGQLATPRRTAAQGCPASCSPQPAWARGALPTGGPGATSAQNAS